jgi:hypoxanthine phosphoribosyltransferase
MEILKKENEIIERIKELAEEISQKYKKLTAVVVLKGAKIFADKLLPELREWGVEVEEAFIRVSSYENSTESSGNIKIVQDIENKIAGKDVLIIEDIVDMGLTIDFLKRYLIEQKGAQSVKVCALANKPARRKVPVEIDYTGFEVPNKFLVGFGMDYQEKYRELPYIAVIE